MQSPADSGTTNQTIPPGTSITTQNWQQYHGFMSDGLQALFAGKYFWKISDGMQLNLGPTHINPPPRSYIDATEKYSSQVKLVELPNGGLTLENYQGGAPFPNPEDPHKGWKILADLWYRYFPNTSVIMHGGGCSIDRAADVNCTAGDIVYRQLNYNTDPGVPMAVPGGVDKFYTQWYMLVEPEQQRYTASLQIVYTDLKKDEDIYAFVPALRRYQRVSTLGRCSMVSGVDITEEDYRSGFDSNLTQLKVDYLGEKKIIALILPKMPDGKFPDYLDLPLGWPKPSWAQWQLRDTYVISVSKLPSESSNYCYGKRVMYVDKTTFAPLWEELYDAKLRPWKIVGLFLATTDVPGVGKVETSGSIIYAFWDIQNDHASFVADPTEIRYPYYANSQVPHEYLDLDRYTTPGGLGMIMR
ncbi:MAG TPA: DUF1329 domain-containing protein [Candidatus Binataceae bacterium]|nr:DUF1329 domain-containing protein [Candidatus Binataceae bacterium]